MSDRRNFVRLKKRLIVAYKIIIDKFANPKIPPNISYTEVISGSGMVLLSPKIIENGTKLDISIEIPGSDIGIVGEVIGHNKIAENQYEIRIKFLEIDEKDRDKLVGYILREGVKEKKQ